MAESFKNQVDALTGFAGTDDDALTVTMTGAATGLILGEATLGTVTITGNTATTTVDVTGADTHTFTLNGSEAGVGGLEVSGTTTFSAAMGATYGLATVNVDTSKVATFSEAVTATTITLTGDAVFKKAVTSTTIALAIMFTFIPFIPFINSLLI